MLHATVRQKTSASERDRVSVFQDNFRDFHVVDERAVATAVVYQFPLRLALSVLQNGYNCGVDPRNHQGSSRGSENDVALLSASTYRYSLQFTRRRTRIRVLCISSKSFDCLRVQFHDLGLHAESFRLTG